ncbi:MAG: hypothetical protein J6386_04305 [Candidatus Synoicihabitans palmerolidicus]|nr:hypothetical protein [Candidatus Synoicihabitans palmerolidicus]
MNWQVKSRTGIWLPQIDWWLDAHRPAPRSVISHAHADHIARHGQAICTPITADLIEAHGGKLSDQIRRLPFDTPFPIAPDTTITLIPAGHVLGSAQALIEHPEFGRLLYTGDFKLRPSLTDEPCATPPANTLIMETTFARPHYKSPPSADTLASVAAFCREALAEDHIPILIGYSLGRSQEILAGLHDAGLQIMLHPTVEAVTRTYEKWGQHFPAYQTFAPLFARGHVIITPSQSLKSVAFQQIFPRRTAVRTGWAMDSSAPYRHQTDAAFPLSDHAGYDDLLRCVEAVNPRRIFTVHGFAEEFAATLRQSGREA